MENEMDDLKAKVEQLANEASVLVASGGYSKDRINDLLRRMAKLGRDQKS